METDSTQHTGTCAKRFPTPAKPLFIGSIPIAASNHNSNSLNKLAAQEDMVDLGWSVQKKAKSVQKV
jgi:hypothetical protein